MSDHLVCLRVDGLKPDVEGARLAALRARKKGEHGMTIGSLNLPGELEARFDGLARLTGKSKISLILTALEEWLDANHHEGEATDKTVFTLTPTQWEAFEKALEAPATPNPALARLLAEPSAWTK